jgi:hypothetical protein
MAQLLEQASVPVTRIAVNQPIPKYRLRKYCQSIIRHVKKVSTEFIQGNRPVLPQFSSLACIELYNSEDRRREGVKLCYDLKDLYCRGVLVSKTFYELRLSRELNMFVKDSVPLNCTESYDGMLGSKTLSQELSEVHFGLAYELFIRLDPDAPNQRLMEAASKIGIISLTLFEPSRQANMMSYVCGGDANSGIYFKMNERAWRVVHSWGLRSKLAKGIEYINNEVVERVSQAERFQAIQQLNIVNSTKRWPVGQ